MHLVLSAPGMATWLTDELLRRWPGAAIETLTEDRLGLGGIPPVQEPWGPLVFARQVLPDATFATAGSVRLWGELLAERIIGRLPEGLPWRFHAVPDYGSGGAGEHRCELIEAALRERLQLKRRHLARGLLNATLPFGDDESLVQLLLTAPDAGFVSVCPSPGPRCQRGSISPFPAGEVPVAVDKAAPSRAFAKLVEAELRLGQAIREGEHCVDLGACPGSWTYTAVQRGARVTAVDRSPLREDLMSSPGVHFIPGDAFDFTPERPVDWLICDVIAAPVRTLELLLQWLENRWCRRFIVTVKFQGTGDYPILDRVKQEIAPRCERFLLLHLCANRNEACAMGVVAP